ncbi:hypothetical protein K6V90_09510 [Cupriavidus pauculus]|uniref:hypothetical protein n=1 Tax=Cupriavidus pauculus TaxID=82633 RepID=UPI001C9338A6|nr:hypothetical protein [Cupriavidus pauculus]MBY4730768.1 hypothetical protein [Cupriavidus pauculus]
MNFDFQSAHEEEFEAERRHEVEMRFKPDVLSALSDIEMRLAQIESDGSLMSSAVDEIRMHMANAVQAIQGSAQPPANIPRWSVHVITILLAIIAFK